MKTFLKIIIGIFLIVVVGMSLILFFAMYERIDNYERSNIWQLIDLSKKGIVYEDDVILQDNIFIVSLWDIFKIQMIKQKNGKKLNKLKVKKSLNILHFFVLWV